jgi:hypothetical protein
LEEIALIHEQLASQESEFSVESDHHQTTSFGSATYDISSSRTIPLGVIIREALEIMNDFLISDYRDNGHDLDDDNDDDLDDDSNHLLRRQ